MPFFGVAALIAGGRSHQLSRPWVAIAVVLWLAVAGLLTAVVRPAEARLRILLAPAPAGGPDPGPPVPPAASGPDPRSSEAASLSRRLSLAAAACDVGFVVALGLMIWQP